MEQSYLYELISALNKEEVELVRQLAQLPFFNNGKFKSFVLPLFDTCLEFKNSQHQPFDKKTVHNTIFPDTPYTEGKIEKLMVETMKIVRSALLIKHLFTEGDKIYQSTQFVNILKVKNLDHRLQQFLYKRRKELLEEPQINTNFYLQNFQLEYAIHDYESLHNQVKGDLNIPNTIIALEQFYHLNRLELINRFLLQQKITGVAFPDIFFETIQKQRVIKQTLDTSPLIQINHAIKEVLEKNSPDISDFTLLQDLIKAFDNKIDFESKRIFFTYLRNICTIIANSNPDDIQIRQYLFNLYKNNLENGFLHKDNKINPHIYLSVPFSAMAVDQHDWAFYFIEKYKNELTEESDSKDIYKFNLALYYFSTKQYQSCIDNIPPASPFINYLIRGKRLELKAYYELRSELLTYKIDSFKMFLSRTSSKLLSDSEKRINQDFINLLKQLSNTRRDARRGEILVKRIRENKQAAEWKWLLEKAMEMTK